VLLGVTDCDERNATIHDILNEKKLLLKNIFDSIEKTFISRF